LRRLLPLLLALSLDCGAETLTIATGEWPPYSGEALPQHGTVMGQLAEAFAKEGITVRFEFMSWHRALELTRAGKYAATPMWLKTADRERDFVLEGPVLTSIVVAFHRKDRPFEWSRPADFAAVNVGVTLGYSYGQVFDKMIADGSLRPDVAPSDELGLIRLAGGHVDVFLLDREVGRYLIANAQREAVKTQLTFSGKPLHSDPTYLLISRKYPGGAAIAKRFAAAWARMQAGASPTL
jgi:polar amino acid transport system substrate-binding protein